MGQLPFSSMDDFKFSMWALFLLALPLLGLAFLGFFIWSLTA
jgi:hypothetical protein